MAIAAFAFTSCDKIADIENFGVNHTFEHELKLDLKDTDPSQFAADYTVDVTSDEDFADNIKKISGYTVKSLNYRISEYDGGDATSATANIQFFNEADPIGKAIDMGVISFNAMANSGNSIDIPISEDLKVLLQDHLLSENTIRVVVSVEVSDKPIIATTVLAMEIEALVKVD